MCTYSMVIDNWRDKSWPPSEQPLLPAPINPIPWPMIQADPKLAAQMLEVLNKLEAIDKRLGVLERCTVSTKDKKAVKARLRRIAARAKPVTR